MCCEFRLTILFKSLDKILNYTDGVIIKGACMYYVEQSKTILPHSIVRTSGLWIGNVSV